MKRIVIVFVFCLSLLVAGNSQAQDLNTKLKTAFAAQYVNLLSIKGKEDFTKHGFGPGFPRANTWMQTSMQLRDLAQQSGNDAIAQGTAALIELGQTYMEGRRVGFKTLDALVRYEDAVYSFRLKVEGTIAQQ